MSIPPTQLFQTKVTGQQGPSVQGSPLQSLLSGDGALNFFDIVSSFLGKENVSPSETDVKTGGKPSEAPALDKEATQTAEETFYAITKITKTPVDSGAEQATDLAPENSQYITIELSLFENGAVTETEQLSLKILDNGSFALQDNAEGLATLEKLVEIQPENQNLSGLTLIPVVAPKTAKPDGAETITLELVHGNQKDLTAEKIRDFIRDIRAVQGAEDAQEEAASTQIAVFIPVQVNLVSTKDITLQSVTLAKNSSQTESGQQLTYSAPEEAPSKNNLQGLMNARPGSALNDDGFGTMLKGMNGDNFNPASDLKLKGSTEKTADLPLSQDSRAALNNAPVTNNTPANNSVILINAFNGLNFGGYGTGPAGYTLTEDGFYTLQTMHTYTYSAQLVQTASANSPLQAASFTHSATQNVAITLQRFAQNGQDANIRMQLDPPEMGRIEVSMRFARDKGMKTVIKTDKPETYTMLQRDAQALEKALQDAGVDIGDDSISFELADDGQDFSHDGRHDNAPSSDNSSGGQTEDPEITETTMTWHVDPLSGHTHYSLLV